MQIYSVLGSQCCNPKSGETNHFGSIDGKQKDLTQVLSDLQSDTVCDFIDIDCIMILLMWLSIEIDLSVNSPVKKNCCP